MIYKGCAKILVDGREFHSDRRTGISRVLEGILLNIIRGSTIGDISLAVFRDTIIPENLVNHKKISCEIIPSDKLRSDLALSSMTKNRYDLYLSPYPNLPLAGCHCKCVNIVHDIFYITHERKKRVKAIIDIFRLKAALKKADLTWYDSQFSKDETNRVLKFTGCNPRVRLPGLDQRFTSQKKADREVLERYKLKPGYILAIGNGNFHKNLKVIIEIAPEVRRSIVFIGVSPRNRNLWANLPNNDKCRWIESVNDSELTGIIKNAFCLVQPSLIEGYGYPPLEAMACGTPAIVSNIPVLSETTGGYALPADPYKPATWIEAIEALENDDKRHRLIQDGLQWTASFVGSKGWIKHVEDIEELIQN
jgi:glycosyltransferase involved in cell wall biosynthesis